DSFIGFYITELGGRENLISLAWFIGLLRDALVFGLYGKWFQKFHPLVFLFINVILYSLRWFMYAGIDNPMYIIALQILHGLTFGVFYTTAFDYVTRLIPKLLQSTGHLIFYSVFFGISGIIGSLIGGALLDMFGGQVLYMTI